MAEPKWHDVLVFGSIFQVVCGRSHTVHTKTMADQKPYCQCQGCDKCTPDWTWDPTQPCAVISSRRKISSYGHIQNGRYLCSYCLEHQEYLLFEKGKGKAKAFGFGKGARGKEKGSNDGVLHGDGWLCPHELRSNEHEGKGFNGPPGFDGNVNNGAASSNGGGEHGGGNTIELVTQIWEVVSRQERQIQTITEALETQASILMSIQSSLPPFPNPTPTQDNSNSSSGAGSWEMAHP